MYNLLVGNTEDLTMPRSPETVFSFLELYLQQMGLQSLRESHAPVVGTGE